MIYYVDPSVPGHDQVRHAGSVVRGTVVTHCRLRLVSAALRLSVTADQTHPAPVCPACQHVIDHTREQPAADSDTIEDPLAPPRRRATPVWWTDPLVIAGAAALVVAIVLILVYLELLR